MGIKFKVKEFKDLPDDVYTAKLKSVEQKKGEHGPYLTFAFEIIDDDEFSGTTINGLANADVTIGNKTYKWLVALNGGKELEADEVGDISEFVGCTVKIVVVHKQDNDRSYARIESVLPNKKKKKKVEEEVEEETPAKAAKKEEAPAKAEEPAKAKKEEEDEDEDEFI